MSSNVTDLETLPTPIEIEGITPSNFEEKITNQYRPAVLKGFAKDWGIVKKAHQSDSDLIQYLTSLAADKPVNLVNLPEATKGRMSYSENLLGMNFKVEQSSLTHAMQTMLHHQPEDKFCVQCISVKDYFPQLAAQLPNPLVPKSAPFIWLGNDITVPAHFDEANNIAVVAAGKRRFTLFPPEQIKNLYIGPLDYTPAGQPTSLVNLRSPDLVRFPNYPDAFAQALSVELAPGDAIFIPSPWWHHVESLSPFNVLINYWWSGNYVSSALPFPMLIHALQAFNAMSSGQKKAWQAMLEHYLFEQEYDPAAHIPNKARGILGTPSTSNQKSIHNWLASQIR